MIGVEEGSEKEESKSVSELSKPELLRVVAERPDEAPMRERPLGSDSSMRRVFKFVTPIISVILLAYSLSFASSSASSASSSSASSSSSSFFGLAAEPTFPFPSSRNCILSFFDWSRFNGDEPGTTCPSIGRGATTRAAYLAATAAPATEDWGIELE